MQTRQAERWDVVGPSLTDPNRKDTVYECCTSAAYAWKVLDYMMIVWPRTLSPLRVEHVVSVESRSEVKR